jgi:hypothetical protein
VTNALNRVFVRLDEQHPALSLHLKSAIATGTTLSYRPSDAVDWQF